MTKLVDCSFRLPERGGMADLTRLVNRVRDTYIKDVPPSATYEIICFPDIGLLRFRSPGRSPASVANRAYDPTLKPEYTYVPELAGFLLEKGTR